MDNKDNIYVPMKGRKIGTSVSQPEVTEEQANKMFDEINIIYYYKDRLRKFKQMLKEAGVKVENK